LFSFSTFPCLYKNCNHQPPAMASPQPCHRWESSRHCPGALHEGDAIRVFSRSSGKVVDGEVMKCLEDGFMWVEYEVEGDRCGKMLHLHSDHLVIPAKSNDLKEVDTSANIVVESEVTSLSDSSEVEEVDPGANFISERETYAALQHVLIRFPESTSWDKAAMALRGQGGLKYHQNNAFYTERPLKGPCEICWNGANDEDVLIKVYTNDAEQPHHWEKYTCVGYIHAQKQRRPVAIVSESSYFLGVALQRDLNVDEPCKLRPQELERKLRRSTRGGWQERGEAFAEAFAEDAHYLLSRATANTSQNDELLQQLTTSRVKGPHGEGPIKYCTDRSLGLGQHFTRQQDYDLYLGKHGFGLPAKIEEWLKLYEAEAKKTKYGILVLNPTPEYFTSDACRKEWQIPGVSSRTKEECRLWVYYRGHEIRRQSRIHQDIITADKYIQVAKKKPPRSARIITPISVRGDLQRLKSRAERRIAGADQESEDYSSLLMELVNTVMETAHEARAVQVNMRDPAKTCKRPVQILAENLMQAFVDTHFPQMCLEALGAMHVRLWRLLKDMLNRRAIIKEDGDNARIRRELERLEVDARATNIEQFKQQEEETQTKHIENNRELLNENLDAHINTVDPQAPGLGMLLDLYDQIKYFLAKHAPPGRLLDLYERLVT